MRLEPLRCNSSRGTLTINNVLLHGKAWCLESSLTPLWTVYAKRGENWSAPFVDGSMPEDTFRDETRHDLRIVVTGAWNGEDDMASEVADYWETYYANLTYLREQLYDPPGTLVAELAVPTGEVLTDDVRLRSPFDPIDEARSAPVGLFGFTIEIFAGLIEQLMGS